MKTTQERVHSSDLTVGFQDSWAADQPLGDRLKVKGVLQLISVAFFWISVKVHIELYGYIMDI